MNAIPAETRQGSEAHSLRLQTAYIARHRWTRTDTARWLNDRGPAVTAAVRRALRHDMPEVKQAGYWIKEHQTALFDRCHTRLGQLTTEAAREQAIVPEIVR